jgi:hypothetical protein
MTKKKKIMITATILSVLFILGDAGVLFFGQAKFGRLPQGERLERIKQSPHYDGKQFVNEVENAKHAASESGKPMLMPQMGEVVELE